METRLDRLFMVYSLNVCSSDSTSIRPGKPLYFSEKKKAEDVILKFRNFYPFLYDKDLQGEHVYCLILEEYETNTPYRSQLSTRVYTPEGTLHGDCVVADDGPFLGRSENYIHHQVGEVVEMPYGDQLVFGVVVSQPMSFNENAGTYGYTASDDCYAVIHHKSNDVNYAHAPLVFKPTREVTEEVREDLLFAFQEMATI